MIMLGVSLDDHCVLQFGVLDGLGRVGELDVGEGGLEDEGTCVWARAAVSDYSLRWTHAETKLRRSPTVEVRLTFATSLPLAEDSGVIPPGPISQSKLNAGNRLALVDLKPSRRAGRSVWCSVWRRYRWTPLQDALREAAWHRRVRPRGDLWSRRSKSIARSPERSGRLLRALYVILSRPLSDLDLEWLVVTDTEQTRGRTTRLDRLEQISSARFVVTVQRTVFDAESVPPEGELSMLGGFVGLPAAEDGVEETSLARGYRRRWIGSRRIVRPKGVAGAPKRRQAG